MAKKQTTVNNKGSRGSVRVIGPLAIELSARGYSCAEIAFEIEQRTGLKRERTNIFRRHIAPNREKIEQRRAELIANYQEQIPICKKEIRLAQLQDALEKARTAAKPVICTDKDGNETVVLTVDYWLADRIMRTIQAEIGEDASKIAEGLKHSGTKVEINNNVAVDYKKLPPEERDRRADEWVRFISASRVRGALGLG
jgi:PHD/YefM family antitoxin component YafN of YafNO toxin-antitoxin module